MFYSQFILAKKGPLGTIWIAAHLERKLKKNQVADTDIGDSVDSILSPDVPIALRLSSHLLLGVVRIYSRKVNYLFHDCSEALLKVKQAFHSTEVDLPPEESTAPYHSITLPETFDLDDFELPDSALLNGNVDDRHVSLREQITLLDTLDGTGCSTPQFGLDERFGDGDASLVALDLDEELLLDNNLKRQHGPVSYGDAHKDEGSSDLAKMDIDEAQLGGDLDRNNEASRELSELLFNDHGKHVISDFQNVNRIDDSSQRLTFNIRTPDLNEVFLPDDHIGGPSGAHNIDMDFAASDPPSHELDEFANFPSMPILANCQALPSSNPQENLPYAIDLANDKLDKPINQEVECPDTTNKNLVTASSTNPKLVTVSSTNPELVTASSTNPELVTASSTNPELDNVARAVSSPTSILYEPKSHSVAPQCSGGIFPSSNLFNDVHHIHNDSNDATNSGNLVFIESTDPKLSEVSRVLPSSTLVLPEAVPDSRVPPRSDGIAVTPGLVGFESTLRTTNNSHAGIVWNAASTLPVSVDSGIPYEDTTRLSNLDQCRVEEAYSYQTNNFSVLNSDFQMRSCTSVSNQANLTFPGDMLLEKTPVFSSRDQPCNLETSMVDQGLHFSGSSFGSEGFPSVAIDTDFGLHQKRNYIQLGHPNRFSNSEFPEPERTLFAPSGNFNLSSDFGLQTIEKVVAESDGNVDRISNLRGKKRRLLDNTPESQNGISPNMSRIPPKKPNDDYVFPKDDDLLGSILVGRTPALKLGPTPPIPKPPSSKRPRLTQKVFLPKRRKVLIDDAIVLHADAMRQQLMNTEDIRRIPRKAPSTRPEIWRIQKSFMLEEDIFCEPIFIGISDELNSLPRRYDPVQNMHAQANRQHSSVEAIKEFEGSESSPLVRDDDGRELIGAESYQNAVSVDAQAQLESTFEVPYDSKIEENRIKGLADAEHNSPSKEFQTSHEAEVNDTAVHTAALVSFKEFTSADRVAVNDGTSVQVEDLSNVRAAASITVENMSVDIVNMTNLDRPQDEQAGMTKDHSDLAEDSSTVMEHVGLVCRDAVVDREKASSDVTCGEMPNLVIFPVPPSTEGEQVPSAVGANSCMNAGGGLDVENTPMEHAATKESSDFCSDIVAVDTDFLNVDDDAKYDEETMNDVPRTEEAQSLEDSGWSARTRGVARYLKTVFDRESGHGRKSVAVDHLLPGKTRKEASRMFFETLVLKTRDFIHVEQEEPFGCINIKPRAKLLSTEF